MIFFWVGILFLFVILFVGIVILFGIKDVSKYLGNGLIVFIGGCVVIFCYF